LTASSAEYCWEHQRSWV